MTTSTKSAKYIATLSAMFLATWCIGCASVAPRLQSARIFLCHDESEDQLPYVNVGGHVHNPIRIEIERSGLTLLRALMAAGTARTIEAEQAPEEREEVPPAIQEIITQAKAIGRLNFYKRAWNLREEVAKTVIPLAKSDVAAARKKLDQEVADLITLASKQLASKQIDPAVLDRIKLAAIEAGAKEEELRLIDKIQVTTGSIDDIKGLLKVHQDKIDKEVWPLLLQRKGAGVRALRGEFLVALSRSTTNPPVTYYFPYDLTLSGLPGEIALQNGDAVDVVDFRDSEISPAGGNVSGAESNVLVDGFVERSGVLSKVFTIGEVHTKSTATIGDARSVWMLVRSSPAGEKIFVLPDHMVQPNGVAAGAPVQEGDIYMYLITPQVPIVFESLLSRTVDGGGGRCLDKFHEKKAQIKETHALRHDYRKLLRTQAQERGQAQAQAKFANGSASGVVSSVSNRLRARLP